MGRIRCPHHQSGKPEPRFCKLVFMVVVVIAGVLWGDAPSFPPFLCSAHESPFTLEGIRSLPALSGGSLIWFFSGLSMLGMTFHRKSLIH